MDKLIINQGFDERQIAARGIAFRNAYLTVLFSEVIIMIVNGCLEVNNIRLFDALAIITMPLMLSLAVFTITVIKYEAYKYYNQKNSAVPYLFAGYGVILSVKELFTLISQNTVLSPDGCIHSSVTGLFSGLCLISIGIAYFIKHSKIIKTDE